MSNLLPALRFTALDSNGDPISGAKLNFYESGTTTRLDTYSDEPLTTAHTNPVVADGAGRFDPIWLSASDYKVVYTDADDVTIWTDDPVHGTLDVTGDEYAPSQQSTPDMTVLLASGALFNVVSKAIVTNAAQTSAVITAPSSNPRKDIIYIDRLTGVVGVTTGAEAGSPSDPTIPDDKLPVARVTLATTTTEITDSLITDIRELNLLGSGAWVRKSASVLAKTTTYTVVIADNGKLIDCDASGGAFTVTLPTVADAGDGFTISVKKTDSSANAVTVDGNGAETIDGATTRTLDERYLSETYRCDGTEWHLESSSEAGKIVQVVNVMDGAVATGTTVMPYDDTIPQNTEGVEYITLAITPKNTNNKLKIEVVFNFDGSNAGTVTAALFQDSTAAAIAAGAHVIANTDDPMQIVFTYYMTAGTTSATTFKIRAGLSTAGTVTFNGAASARLYGGVMASSITITEIAA